MWMYIKVFQIAYFLKRKTFQEVKLLGQKVWNFKFFKFLKLKKNFFLIKKNF